MKLETFAEHTIATDITSNDGMVLDVGCRIFSFSQAMTKRGFMVVALDPDPTIEAVRNGMVVFDRRALTTKRGKSRFKMHKDPQARTLDPDGEVEVETVDIQNLTDEYTDGLWEVVKLDCEGAEYEVLLNWPGPISKQVTVEFHEHIKPQSPLLYERILIHMSRWYNVIQHTKSDRHCAGQNYWDSLFCLKEYCK